MHCPKLSYKCSSPPPSPAAWKDKKEYKHKKEYSHDYKHKKEYSHDYKHYKPVYKHPYHKNYKYVVIKGVFWYDYDYCGKKYFKCFDDHHNEVGICDHKKGALVLCCQGGGAGLATVGINGRPALWALFVCGLYEQQPNPV
jgi:hypothetical protein